MGLFTKVSLTNEGAGVWSLNDLAAPDLPLSLNYLRPTNVRRTEAGYKYVNFDKSTEIIAIDLNWSNLTDTEKDAIETFYNDHDGQLTPFLYTLPDESSARKFMFTTNFESGLQSRNRGGGKIYSLTLSIQEILIGP